MSSRSPHTPSAVVSSPTRVADSDEMLANKRAARRGLALGPIPRADRERVRVLYVVDRDDAPFRYRAANGCEQLREAGLVANVMQLGAPDLLAMLPSYSVVILFRIGFSLRVRLVIDTARANGARVGFDIDDLIFEPEAGQWMPFLHGFSEEHQDEYRVQFAALGESVRNVDFCVGATPTIARHARMLGTPAVVHPNLLSRDHTRLSHVLAPLRFALLRRPVIAYLSGSNTHNGDLASISDAIAHVLSARPDSQFVIGGHADLPAALATFGSRVLRMPYEHYSVYPWVIAQCAAVLAPIEAVNEFSDAKSALKVFEANAFGAPAVASPTLQYEHAIEHGVTGFVARTDADWRAALLELTDIRRSRVMGRSGRDLALASYSPDAYRGALARELIALSGTVASAEPPDLLPIEPERSRKRRAKHLGRSLRIARNLEAASREV